MQNIRMFRILAFSSYMMHVVCVFYILIIMLPADNGDRCDNFL